MRTDNFRTGNMKTGKVLLGVVAGVAIGAALGVLFAPEKGTELRNKISRKKGDYLNNIKDKFNEVAENASDKLNSVKDRFTNSNNGENLADSVLDQASGDNNNNGNKKNFNSEDKHF